MLKVVMFYIYVAWYSNSLSWCSQKVNIAELKEQLDEEWTQRKEEREKAAGDLKAAVHRAQSEAQEELKRLSDASLRRERELQETINKLQVWKLWTFDAKLVRNCSLSTFRSSQAISIYIVGVRERNVFAGWNLEVQTGIVPSFLLLLA